MCFDKNVVSGGDSFNCILLGVATLIMVLTVLSVINIAHSYLLNS